MTSAWHSTSFVDLAAALGPKGQKYQLWKEFEVLREPRTLIIDVSPKNII